METITADNIAQRELLNNLKGDLHVDEYDTQRYSEMNLVEIENELYSIETDRMKLYRMEFLSLTKTAELTKLAIKLRGEVLKFEEFNCR